MAAGINTGDYLVIVRCPHCGREAQVPCVIEQVLKVKGQEGSLSVALSAKPVPHDCEIEQLSLEQELQGNLIAAADALVSSLPDGTSMSLSTVDRETGEIREATVVGRGVSL